MRLLHLTTVTCFCADGRLAVMGPLAFMPYVFGPRRVTQLQTTKSGLIPPLCCVLMTHTLTAEESATAAGSRSGQGASLPLIRASIVRAEYVSLWECLIGLPGCRRSLLKCLFLFANICYARMKLSQITQSTDASPGQRICGNKHRFGQLCPGLSRAVIGLGI